MKKLALVFISFIGVVSVLELAGCGKTTPGIATAYLPDGYVNIAYEQTLKASGGSGAYAAWSITFGSLPDGLSLDSSTGLISGIPATNGTSIFTLQVTDSNGTTASKNISITIQAAPSITTTSLPDGHVNTPYSQSLEAAGGSGIYTWKVIAGALPTGLSLDSSIGIISGTPDTAGSSSFTVQITDSNGDTATQALSITIATNN